MTGAGARNPLPFCKAIATLLPYAVWKERDGKREMFDTVLGAVKAAKPSGPIWKHIPPDLIQHLDHALGQVAIQPGPPGLSRAVSEGPIQEA